MIFQLKATPPRLNDNYIELIIIDWIFSQLMLIMNELTLKKVWSQYIPN